MYPGQWVAVDGKELLNSQGMEIVSAGSVAGCANQRKATMSGFCDARAAKPARKPFSLVTTVHPSWSPSP